MRHSIKLALVCSLLLTPALSFASNSASHFLNGQTPTEPEKHSYTLLLNYVTGIDIIQTMHWLDVKNLPPGVFKIETSTDNRVLRASATLAGLKNITEILRQLDVEPQRVELSASIAKVQASDLAAAGLPSSQQDIYEPIILNGMNADRLYKVLAKSNRLVTLPARVVANNAETTFIFLPTSAGAAKSTTILVDYPPLLSDTITLVVSPRINNDQTVTLSLITEHVQPPVSQRLETHRTIRNHGQVAFNGLTPSGDSDSEFFIFTKATILSNKSSQ